MENLAIGQFLGILLDFLGSNHSAHSQDASYKQMFKENQAYVESIKAKEPTQTETIQVTKPTKADTNLVKSTD